MDDRPRNPVYTAEQKDPIIFNDDLKRLIEECKVLVVGAGGIGCELLKNLVLTGFGDIEVVDLDTIDVSNLNRQFLFQKRHVGKSKAHVARESVLQFNPKANIVAHHASIMSKDFGMQFIQKFTVVMNALDNLAARNHVNRLCLAAGVPLIESGTSGFFGQVELISKGLSKCYECLPQVAPKTFPGCTIRNTPSEHIHCTVWGKHLFSQLFGEDDPSREMDDVSPDTAETDGAAVAGGEPAEGGDIRRVSTRQWAREVGYAGPALFNKLFTEDIKWLLEMASLWESRKPPIPLSYDTILNSDEENPATPPPSDKDGGLPDQKVWTLKQSVAVFIDSLASLAQEMKQSSCGYLEWDKDVKVAMDFVAAAANIRAHIFGIPPKSRFEIKSMAGNIVPAVATSNAIIAGLVVLMALNILRQKTASCQSVYLRTFPNFRNYMIVREAQLLKPNPYCTVCSLHPQIGVAVDLKQMTVKELESQVLVKTLHMIQPDAQVDQKGTIIISSEEGETEHLSNKTLLEMGLSDGTILLVDDFVQNYTVRVVLHHKDLKKEDPSFSILGDLKELNPKDESTRNGDREAASGSSKKSDEEEDDDDLMILYKESDEEEEDMIESKKKKRKMLDGKAVPAKKRRTEDGAMEPLETIEIM